VSAVLSALAVSDRSSSPAARFTPLGRLAAAGTLVVGATFQVLAFALIPDYSKTLDRLQWVAAHPAQAQVSKTFDLLAVPFLFGGVIVYVLLGRERAPRLAWMMTGLSVCFAASRIAIPCSILLMLNAGTP